VWAEVAVARARARDRVRMMESEDGWTSYRVALNVLRRRQRRAAIERRLLPRRARRCRPRPRSVGCVRHLPARHRTAVVFRHVGGLTRYGVSTGKDRSSQSFLRNPEYEG